MEQEQRRYELNGGSQLQRQLEALPSPSDMADSNRWSQEQNHELFRCFRPTAGFGPTRALPVALYDPVLDTLVELFGAALKGGGDVGSSSSSSGGGGGADGVPLSNADCELASRLCEAMAESFAHEAARMAAFNEVFRGYLCEHIETHHPSRNWKRSRRRSATRATPTSRASAATQLDLTNPQLAAAVEHTVLPALFVELVGPHLRVSALASPADATVVCEPLTPYLHLFNMLRLDWTRTTWSAWALVLRALKSGIGLLLDRGGRLQQPTAAAVPAPAAPAPASASEYSDTAVPRVEVPLRDQALQRPYPLRPGSGYRDVRPIGAGVYHPLYFAVLDACRRAAQQQLHGAVVAALARAHAVVVDADRGLCGVHADMRQANVMVRLPPPREDADGGGGGGSGGSGSVAGTRGAVVVLRAAAVARTRRGGGSGGGSQPQQQQVAQQGYGCGCAVTQEYDRALWNWEWVFGPM
ncbi:hypothetical protein HXX76_016307 [Chlamydomonas incerta]|uniref:Uncharacterized protein n=1 Tax=Chlamydomonas incerta TaxID=51695 RepID=A0A835SL95_CHLIN|nr:hypothetical protein HXX76_016307 [Chlamydomonas incerta]|eukprot:KAG2422061.1 hypothetical protein HXX76_016307 [Chlamydomonas incerta]